MVVIMNIGVLQPGAVDRSAVIEHRARPFLRRLEASDKLGELLHLVALYLCQLLNQLRVSAVVRDGVMRFRHFDFRVGPQSAFARQHKRSHARGVSMRANPLST